jgi:putative hemolysin
MSAIPAILAFVLLGLAAWVRAAGTAVTRVPRADALRDASDGVKGASKVAALLDDRDQITPAAGVVVSGLLVLSSVVATAVIIDRLDPGRAIVVALLVGAVIFVFGDPVPRALGRVGGSRVAYRSATLLAAAVRLGGWANDLLAEEEVEDDEPNSLEEVAEEAERELIDSVLEFSETLVREVMTPRPDMVTIPMDASIEELISLATEEGYSRVPVTANGDVVGIVIVKDLLATITDDDRPRSVDQVMRPVEFVPETKYAAALLSEMRERHLHQVVVVDEFGDIAGLVTIEDLIEELVGEISDETDEVEQMITLLDGYWMVDARAAIDDLAREIGVPLPDEDWDTVGGLILGLAERMPEEGEVFSVDGVDLRVTRMQGRRISEVEVTLAGRAGVE